MKNTIIIAAAIALLPSLALAQNAGGAVGGAVGGAAVGTVVGGPVGTVVGAGIGALVGSSLPPQPSVTYDGQMVVGGALPDGYTYYPVPQYQDYDYVIVNNQRVIVDHRTRKIVRVIP
jgi:outer membrane lipoprotein SlyB